MQLSRICIAGSSRRVAGAGGAHAARIVADRVVAVVNRSGDYPERTERSHPDRDHNLGAQPCRLPPADVLRQQVLERLINEAVQLQYATDTGIRIDDAQLTLDRAYRPAEQHVAGAVSRRAGKDGVDFRKFREDIRGEITMSRLREREVDSRVIVSDVEVDNLLETAESQRRSRSRN